MPSSTAAMVTMASGSAVTSTGRLVVDRRPAGMWMAGCRRLAGRWTLRGRPPKARPGAPALPCRQQPRLAGRLVAVAAVGGLTQHGVPLVFVKLRAERSALALFPIDADRHPLEAHRLSGRWIRVLVAGAADADVIRPGVYRNVGNRGHAAASLFLHPRGDDGIESAGGLQALRDGQLEVFDALLVQRPGLAGQLARIE